MGRKTSSGVMGARGRDAVGGTNSEVMGMGGPLGPGSPGKTGPLSSGPCA